VQCPRWQELHIHLLTQNHDKDSNTIVKRTVEYTAFDDCHVNNQTHNDEHCEYLYPEILPFQIAVFDAVFVRLPCLVAFAVDLPLHLPQTELVEHVWVLSCFETVAVAIRGEDDAAVG
jgi:hypothetical protein